MIVSSISNDTFSEIKTEKLGIGTSLFGVMLVTLGEGGAFEFDLGSLLILIAALSTSVYFIFQKDFILELKSISHWFCFKLQNNAC